MLSALSRWAQSARWHASVMHLLEMWVAWIPCFVATQSTAAAACGVVAWYWSRKMTEVREAADPGHEVLAWQLGWFPWQWWAASPYLVLDFALPAAVSIAIVAI